MADIFLRGTDAPQLQRKTRRYNPDGGFLVSSDFASFSEAQIIQLFNWAAGQGLEVEMTSKFGRHELTIVDSRGETRIDRWSFDVSTEQPRLVSNPWLQANVEGGAIADDWLFVLAVARENPNHSLAEVAELDKVIERYPTLSATSPGQLARIRRVHRLLIEGSTQYETGALVLQHVTNVSNRFSSNIAEVNENCVYDHADFLSEVTDSSLWLFPLPGRLQYKATSFWGRNAPPPRDDGIWGWLKSVSSETAVANNRVEILTRYKLAHWSRDVYPVA
jgi:hypothetical protein